MPAEVAPIGPQEAAGLLAACDRPLAIAVSGGADSMALMHLLAAWRRQGGGNAHSPPLVLTVDHGLRPASADEAAFVAGVAQQLGFGHETLVWTGAKPTSGIQDAARRARYDLLLARLAAEARPRDLLLAHHQEDQAETLLMRLARGSGIDGLAGMRPLESRIAVVLEAPVREAVIRLRRPLLDVAKARLIATLQAIGASWREDPTNADLRYERVRLRRAQSMLAADLGLTPAALARSARRLAAERVSLQQRTQAIAAGHVRDHGGVYGTLTLPSPQYLPPADVVRLLARMLDIFGGAAPAAQLSQIETLAERVASPLPSAGGRLTLGGCLIDIRAGEGEAREVDVFREIGRASLPPVTVQPGEGLFWDRRFYISMAAGARTGAVIEPLPAGAGQARLLGVTVACLAGLPGVRSEDAIIPLFGGSKREIDCRWPMQHAAALRWQEPGDGTRETI
jgi:tRNA(Ile)-lysidine synthase